MKVELNYDPFNVKEEINNSNIKKQIVQNKLL